jgi:quinoprotein glucose dehydrogenase
MAVLASTAALDAQKTRSVQEGIYTDEQANRGSARYHDVCETCHAPDLSGGKVVPEMVGETFTGRWAGQTVGQLFERIVVSMPVDDPPSVSRRDKVDILAFILSVNGFPPGGEELPEQTRLLDRFRFESVGP